MRNPLGSLALPLQPSMGMSERAAAASPSAARPFEFTGCVELREILGRRARDERELMEEIEGAPAESIYYHTDSVFLRRPLVAGSYPNDFAIWVAAQIRDQVLAERLGMVDPFQFRRSRAGTRGALVDTRRPPRGPQSGARSCSATRSSSSARI